MKIILAVTDTKRKSIAFAFDEGRVVLLPDAIHLVQTGAWKDVSVVKRRTGAYLRSRSNSVVNDNVEFLSVSARDVSLFIQRTHAHSTPALGAYVQWYLGMRAEPPTVTPVRTLPIPASTIRIKEKLIPHALVIRAAAKRFDIDPYLLGAIVIDEIARALPFEALIDTALLKGIGRNVSAGIAQIKLETANDTIKKGLYNPNPDDRSLPIEGNLRNNDRKRLYVYVVNPKHNLYFAAAYMRAIVDHWMRFLDLRERPEIIATLYSQGYGTPKANPRPSERGTQIADEFYRLATEWIDTS